MKVSIETFFNLPNGSYCGVMLRKRLYIRYLKLQQEYLLKVKKLLASNLDELEISNWTMSSYDDRYDPVYVRYYGKNTTDKEKLAAIEKFKLYSSKPIETVLEVKDNGLGGRAEAEEYCNHIYAERFLVNGEE